MAQNHSNIVNPTPINRVRASSEGSPLPLRRQVETKTVEARFYTTAVLIDGVVYDRSREQEKGLALCRGDEAEADLLALVPDTDREQAASLLLQAVDAHSDWHTADSDRLEAHLVEMLPQHEPMIRAIFCPEEADIPCSEAVRHMRCTLAPATSTTQEGAQ